MGGKSWHHREDETLTKMWPLMPLSEIYTALPKRSRHSINNRASSVLKLYRFPEARRHNGKGIRNLAPVIVALRRAREAQALTLVDAGKKIGVPRVTIQKWEHGWNQPRFAMLIAWAQALGFEISLRAKTFRRSGK